MKILRIPLVIVLGVLAGRALNAGAQTEIILHSFDATMCPDEANHPVAGLIPGSDGNFYGTTHDGSGVFQISPSGTYTNFIDSCSSPDIGFSFFPGWCEAATAISTERALTAGRAPTANPGPGCGTVFRISPSGNAVLLYSFTGSPDGAVPEAGLVQGSDGNFYGTTYVGGANNIGTVFRISPGSNYTNLYSFVGSPNDGANPQAGLAQDIYGNFYGTTTGGGTNGSGTVFRISPSGGETVLYSFAGSPIDGAYPEAGLVQGSDGNFYGTTVYGGTYNNGTVFRISPSGGETVLYSFAGSPTDGVEPFGGLVQGSDGNFYGTTVVGGANNLGTVYKLSVPLSSTPNQIAQIQVLGPNIILNLPTVAGETYQLQYRSSPTSGIWSNVPVSLTNSMGSTVTFTNPAGATPQGFYRFDITP